MTLYDLTNTCFEGAAAIPKAARGHSKEKRCDCPLLTLGLVLDASGFARCSQVFSGSVREHETMETMQSALGAPAGALVAMDRGVASEDRVRWLRGSGYRHLVVSRERRRRIDAEAAEAHGTHSGDRAAAAGRAGRGRRGAPRLAAGERSSWTTPRGILAGQQRVTATCRHADVCTLPVRAAAETAQKAIHNALVIDAQPGGTVRTVVCHCARTPARALVVP